MLQLPCNKKSTPAKYSIVFHKEDFTPYPIGNLTQKRTRSILKSLMLHNTLHSTLNEQHKSQMWALGVGWQIIIFVQTSNEA